MRSPIPAPLCPHRISQDLPGSCEHRIHTESHRTHKSHRTSQDLDRSCEHRTPTEPHRTPTEPHRTPKSHMTPHRTSQDLTGPLFTQVLYRTLQNPTEPREGSVQNPPEPSGFWAQNPLAGVYAALLVRVRVRVRMWVWLRTNCSILF